MATTTGASRSWSCAPIGSAGSSEPCGKPPSPVSPPGHHHQTLLLSIIILDLLCITSGSVAFAVFLALCSLFPWYSHQVLFYLLKRWAVDPRRIPRGHGKKIVQDALLFIQAVEEKALRHGMVDDDYTHYCFTFSHLFCLVCCIYSLVPGAYGLACLALPRSGRVASSTCSRTTM